VTKELSPREQAVFDIFDANKALTNARLVNLSNLNDEGLGFLEQAWTRADTERRRKVIASLVHLSETDLTLDFSRACIFCLADSDEDIRLQAISGLEAEENPIFVVSLLRALKDVSVKVRAAAAMALGAFALQGELGGLPPSHADKIYTALLEVLDNKDEQIEVHRRALEAISPFSLPRVKKLIEKAYHSGNMNLKASAIYAMGRNCDPVWLTPLTAELSSAETEMRYEAASACGELGAKEAVPHLVKLTSDSDTQVKEAAMKALGEIGGEESKQALRKLSKSTNTQTSEAAKAALKELLFCEDPLSPEFQMHQHWLAAK
jgi:HEAT repeat protein